jgi:hypothetical protein
MSERVRLYPLATPPIEQVDLFKMTCEPGHGDAVSFWVPRNADIQAIAAIAKSVSPNPTVLEVGCGNAFATHLLARELPVIAVDPNEEALKSTPYRHSNLDLRVGTDEDCIDMFKDTPVDVVICAWMPQGIDLSDSIYALNPKVVIFIRDGLGQDGTRKSYGHRNGYKQLTQWLGFTMGDISTFFRDMCAQLNPRDPYHYYSVEEAKNHPEWSHTYEKVAFVRSNGLKAYNIFDVRIREDISEPEFPLKVDKISPYPWEEQLNHLTNNRYVIPLYTYNQEDCYPPIKSSNNL